MEIPKGEQVESKERPVDQESEEDNSNERKEQPGKSTETSRQEIKGEKELLEKYPGIKEITDKREEILALFLKFGELSIKERLEKLGFGPESIKTVLTTDLIPEEQQEAFFGKLFTEILQIENIEEADIEVLRDVASKKIGFAVGRKELSELLGENKTEEEEKEKKKEEDIKEKISSKLQELAEFAVNDNDDIISVLEKRKELEEFIADIKEQAEQENADLSPLEKDIKYLEDTAKKLLEKQQKEDSAELDEKLKAISDAPTEETTDPIEKAEQDRAKVIDKIQAIKETREKWDAYSDDFKTLNIDVQTTETAEEINEMLKNLREEKGKLDKIIIEEELKSEPERQVERENGGKNTYAERIKAVNEVRKENMGKMAVVKSELETEIVELTKNYNNLSEDEKRRLKELEEWKEIVVTNEAAMTGSFVQNIPLTEFDKYRKKSLENPKTMSLEEVATLGKLIADVLEPALRLQGMKIEKEMMAVPPRVREGVRRESTRAAEETEEIMRKKAASETPTSPIEASFEEVEDREIENVKLGEQRIYSYDSRKGLLKALEKNTKGYPAKKWFGLRNNKPEEKKEEDLNTIAEAIANYLKEINYKGRANWNVAEIERNEKTDEENGEASFRVYFKKENDEIATDINNEEKKIIGYTDIKIEYGKEGQEYKEAKWPDGKIKRDFLITIEKEEFLENFKEETERRESDNHNSDEYAKKLRIPSKETLRIIEPLSSKESFGEKDKDAIKELIFGIEVAGIKDEEEVRKIQKKIEESKIESISKTLLEKGKIRIECVSIGNGAREETGITINFSGVDFQSDKEQTITVSDIRKHSYRL